jgi:hypothetical protein
MTIGNNINDNTSFHTKSNGKSHNYNKQKSSITYQSFTKYDLQTSGAPQWLTKNGAKMPKGRT